MYSSNSYHDSEVINMSSNISSNRIHDANSNEASNHLEITNDSHYITTNGSLQIAYLPNEILHHQISIKKSDVPSYMQAKDPNQLIHVYGDSSAAIITSSNSSLQNSLPMLTPLKYVEYVSEPVKEEQMLITNDESDKSDCESVNELHKTPSKHRRNLPHKKRIAKKLNQPYNQQEQFTQEFTEILPSEVSTSIRNVPAPIHHYDCNLCGAQYLDQLEFFVHLKQHYEPPMQYFHHKVKHNSDCSGENLMIDNRQHQVDVPESLIESLEDSQENIKEELQREPLPEIDEFNEFSDEEVMMEDLRKEVEKVVETIADNECLPEATWNYQDEIEEQEEAPEDLQLYSENLEANYDDIENSEVANDNDNSSLINHNDDPRDDSEDDDDEDDFTLEQVRQSLQKTTREDEMRKLPPEDDKEDMELTECLKKIHNFKCTVPTCNKAFNSRTALGYHIKTHQTERRYVCDQCGKKFLTNGALKVHQRLHSDARPYECKFPGCGKSFRQWGDLKYHETSIHSDKKDHVCEFCAKAFARKYSLVIHRRIHTGERNYKCTECDKSFRASSYLLNHSRIHTGEKPYCCSVTTCLKKFRVVGDLKRHMKIHERSKLSSKEKKKEVEKKVSPEPEAPIIDDMDIKEEAFDLSSKNLNSVVLLEVQPKRDDTVKKGRKTSRHKKGK